MISRQTWAWVMIFIFVTGGGVTAGAARNSGPDPRPPTVCVEQV
jgi:hypothetical protein